jgi:hypothetical protein
MTEFKIQGWVERSDTHPLSSSMLFNPIPANLTAKEKLLSETGSADNSG